MATKKPAPKPTSKPKRKSAPKSALKSAPQRGPEGRRKTGRPSLVDDPQVLERARLAYQIGMTDQEVAKLIGVTPTTLYNWAIKSPTFFEALKSGKALADNRVEQSLYQRALGYTYRAEKAFCHQGAIIKGHVDEHVPPDVTAQIFWLKNRQPAQWRDVRQMDVNVEERRAEVIAIIERMELAALARPEEGGP